MKFIKIIFPFILIFIIIIISHNTYNNAKAIDNSPLSVIPNHSSIILKINKPNKIFDLINNKIIWQKLNNVFNSKKLNNNIREINTTFNTLNLKERNSLYLTLLKDGVSSSGFLISSELSEESIEKIKDTYKLSNTKSSKYDNIHIYNIHNDSLNIFFTNVSNLACFSSSKTIIEDAIKAFNSEYNFANNDKFLNIYNTLNNSTEINIIYNLDNFIELSEPIANSMLKSFNNLNDWVAADMTIKDEKIILNGYNLINYKLSKFADILNNQKSEEIRAFSFIPENINHLFSLGFNNINELYSNNNKLLEKNNKIWEIEKDKKKTQETYKFDYNEFINHIDNEAGIFNTGSINEENYYTYFRLKESIHAYSLIQRIINPEKSIRYLDKEINYISESNLVSNIFGEHFKFTNHHFFIEIDDYFIFSKSPSNLEIIIDNYISGSTLENNANFTRFKDNTLSKSNVFIYINTAKFIEKISSDLNLSTNLDSLEKFTGLSYQITNNKSYQINNFSLYYDEDFKESIKEKWFVQLDTLSKMKPQVIYNHSLKKNAVVIQDLAKKIYYITDSKKYRWDRNLNELIIGSISQGDFFKNNKTQMLFNSANNVFMLDIYGRDVERFPIKIKGSTKIEHSLFDYNKSKRYRIILAKKDNSILNLDSKGKNVIGWKHNKNNTINQKLIHFKEKNKDYILSASKNEIELLAINGTSRLKFKSNYTLNNVRNIIIDNKSNLITVNNNNQFFICNLDGSSSEISVSSLDSSSKIAFNKERNELIFSNKNNLYFLDENFNEVDIKRFNNQIKGIEIFNNYMVIQTRNEIFLFKNNEIINGTPLKYDGTYSIANLSNNDKINILLTRKKILYNYELE